MQIQGNIQTIPPVMGVLLLRHPAVLCFLLRGR